MAPTNHDYTVGWIAALPLEQAAAEAMMDRPLHPPLPRADQDSNIYTLGRIGNHNVVLACLPTMGTNTAAHAAANMRRSFPKVDFALMVGVGGGVPGPASVDPTKDVRLGDIVISTPNRQHGGVIQYDFGTLLEADIGGEFVRKGHLNKPPAILLNAMRKAQTDAELGTLDFNQHYTKMLEDHPEMIPRYVRPAIDNLYKPEYHHREGEEDCASCSDENLIERRPRSEPVVHYGLIGSANRVLRSAAERDRLYKNEGVICFEMEAAGLMDNFSCIVIRGICDYCDSHKSKAWQPYASAIAAAFGKELLLNIPPIAVINLLEIQNPNLTSTPCEFLSTRGLTNESRTLEPLAEEQKVSPKQQSAENPFDPEKYRDCLRSLKCIHPRVDKVRLEDTKGGLLRDIYKWILNTEEYKAWLTTDDSMWIKGDPGKGKTMLICGIVDELLRPTALDRPAAYFFCQATLDTNNSAIQVLRGLILSILEAKPSVSSIIGDKIQLTEGLPQESLFYALSDILEILLEGPSTVLIIDALDECMSGLDKLLRFIVKTSSSRCCKWLVSSRNVPEIGEHLDTLMRLSLELNEASVSNSVALYIRYKVKELSTIKRYDRIDSGLQSYITQYLQNNCEDTFLWVSLVCQKLSKARPYQAKNTLRASPPGLHALYQQMLDGLENSDDCQRLKEILAVVSVVFRPVSIEELGNLIDLGHGSGSDADSVGLLEDLVDDCGCFLTRRDSIVNLVHLSAKDFLTTSGAGHVFKNGESHTHQLIFVKSIGSLQVLRRDLYDLQTPSIEIGKIEAPTPDPIAGIKYATVYWPNHLLRAHNGSPEAQLDAAHGKLISDLLLSKYLYWLEALCLLRSSYPTMETVAKLEIHLKRSLQNSTHSLDDDILSSTHNLLQDAIHFFRYFQYAIVEFPLQIYVSGLLFCPTTSYIREAFAHESPMWVNVKSGLKASWPTTLSLDAKYANLLRWSPNEEMLLTFDAMVGHLHLWDASSGKLLATIKQSVSDCIFSEDSQEIITLGRDCETVKTWSVADGKQLKTLPLQASRGYLDSPPSSPRSNDHDYGYQDTAVLSRAKSLVARVWEQRSNIIDIISMKTSLIVQQLTHDCGFYDLQFAPSGRYLAALDRESAVYIWNVESGQMIWETDGFSRRNAKLVFSHCSDYLAIQSDDVIVVWDWSSQSKQPLMKIPQWLRYHERLVFHPHNSSVFISNETMIEQWQVLEDRPFRKFRLQWPETLALAISEQGSKIAAAGVQSVQIWDLHGNDNLEDCLEDISQAMDWKIRPHLYKNLLCGLVSAQSLDTYECRLWVSKLESPNEGNIEKTRYSLESLIINNNGSRMAINILGGARWQIRDLENATTHYLEVGDSCDVVALGPGETELTNVDHNLQRVWTCTLDGKVLDMWPLPWNTNVNDQRDFKAHWSPDKVHFVLFNGKNVYLWHAFKRRWMPAALGQSECNGWSMQMNFSPDSALLAVNSLAFGLRMFLTDRLKLVFYEENLYSSHVFTFDDDQWLRTDTRRFKYDKENDIVVEQPSDYMYLSDNTCPWICLGLDRIILLPIEYRTETWTAIESNVVLALDCLSVMVLNIHLDRLNDMLRRSRSGPIESSIEG